MDRDPDERPHPDGGVDAFDEIVSGWRREGPVPEWPTDGIDPGPPSVAVPGADEGAGADEVPVAEAAPAAAPTPDEEHFVPPEPPPIPRIGPPAAVGLVLLVIGIVLVTAPGWLGVPTVYGLPLGLLTLAAGLGWLVLRLWPAPPDDGDDGAVV